MTTEELKKLQNGEVEISVSKSKYEEALITIKKSEIVAAGSTYEDLYPLNQSWAKDQACLKVEFFMISESYPLGKTYSFADIYVNLKGQPAYYEAYLSTKESDNDGLPLIKRGKLLWDIVNGIKQHDSKSVYHNEWHKTFKPADLIGQRFQMSIKYVQSKTGIEFVILNDSTQKLQDERYRELNKKTDVNVEIIKDEELDNKTPF